MDENAWMDEKMDENDMRVFVGMSQVYGVDFALGFLAQRAWVLTIYNEHKYSLSYTQYNIATSSGLDVDDAAVFGNMTHSYGMEAVLFFSLKSWWDELYTKFLVPNLAVEAPIQMADPLLNVQEDLITEFDNYHDNIDITNSSSNGQKKIKASPKHLHTKNFKCKWCERTYKTTDAVRKHCRMGHKDILQQVAKDVTSEYCCEL